MLRFVAMLSGDWLYALLHASLEAGFHFLLNVGIGVRAGGTREAAAPTS